MKNIFIIIFVICLTIFSAYYMITSEYHPKENTSTKHEKKEKKKSVHKKEDELKINNLNDLQEIVYGNKDEKTKMNAYNQAVEKNLIPRSNNYQSAVYAYEESIWIKNNTN
ncbi:hypothetical protein P3U44_12335 [Mammaliicoccus sciuri]|uniref:hypothetical protein n=1 Tax=Mammaliicoccus sciuri TaxID=1296 RepID=UPI001A98DEBE|nr:hypothetical protein [Mammaliicoccus sciuri]MBO1209484.1 hypothetical protein [Mammaliicoccus sciuri]MEB5567789.1 hypothetical protein [Mammaliicoccus sciuri]MEB8071967.1 hypothetical protein [Mammaliicoccus sciuri]WQJ73633.1 hypothetical protein P3U44_12335 [Mammaliicoccus sciuri]WQK42086.1 hypothetical protein P3T89_12210 [Mammaliicoccus sciuri]